jgi:phosphate transport system substrate-binding protein
MGDRICPASFRLVCVFAAVLTNTHAGAQSKLTIDGSTGTAPLVAALGKAFSGKTGVVVEIGKGLGTKARFEALAAGKIDIAMASHGLKPDEVAARGMAMHRIATTPVVFAVHESIGTNGLTDAQLCAIYAGRSRNWTEFGGPDLVIAPMIRPDSEVDAEVVRDGIACLKGLQMPDTVKVLARAGDMARALSETPGSIGMTSATVVEQSQGKIRPLVLNGVAATEAEVNAGRYRLIRDACLVTRNPAPAEVAAFIGFVTSSEGAAVIRANGAMAVAR